MARRTQETQRDQHAAPNGPGGAMTLDRLLEAERELAELVALAREDAARVHASVPDRLHDLEARAEADLRAAIAALAGATGAAADREEQDVTAAAAAAVARYAAVPDETVARLATEIVHAFLDPEPGGRRS